MVPSSHPCQDPKEALPQEYSRVFAFEQFARAQKRARAAQEAAGSLTDLHGVAPGTPCLVVLRGVSPEAATALHARVEAARQGAAQPPVAVGLLQHEAKLSVVHWGVSKAPAYEPPLANKEELLFVTGVRCVLRCRAERVLITFVQDVYGSAHFQHR